MSTFSATKCLYFVTNKDNSPNFYLQICKKKSKVYLPTKQEKKMAIILCHFSFESCIFYFVSWPTLSFRAGQLTLQKHTQYASSWLKWNDNLLINMSCFTQQNESTNKQRTFSQLV